VTDLAQLTSLSYSAKPAADVGTFLVSRHPPTRSYLRAASIIFCPSQMLWDAGFSTVDVLSRLAGQTVIRPCQ